ncbi:predicted protein [Histoplasma mississippiense (nom. inval.)]|uniref:predicted protein n=1 Tax=Ajellomyces capsulatus (strain NAm1 / WU24) TaxID=2059318 RepID=UPI000157B437|nr:predicted protein [Histoplasma mississippiense (nom. inval.)]EDN02326.1 predicted protein [Histoplasma mississippiense (nom. inval.)]
MSLLQTFLASMESVYGNFSTVPDATKWRPPPKSGGHRGRYLWTDAFGVLNFLTLYKELSLGGDSKATAGNYLIFAQRLIATVHDVLGRTRDGLSRLPHATDEEPLKGGLRIGKEEETGPDGDGQYFHYLTMWMFALNRMSIATGDPTYNRTGYFTRKGYPSALFLNRTRKNHTWHPALQYGDGEILKEEIADYKKVMACKGDFYVTRDPLDLGMTLWTAHWFADRENWARRLADKCVYQLHHLFEEDHFLETDLQFRNAYREFGICLGIACLTCREASNDEGLNNRSQEIVTQWQKYISSPLTPEDLKPITNVMYSTALIPGAFKSRYLGTEPIDQF